MKLANADQKDTDTALAIGGLLNDLEDCNSALGYCTIRTLEFIDNPDAEEQAENPLEDFDPEDGEHCKILVDRLLKLLDRSPGCLNRVLWGYSTLRSNNVIDLESDHLAFHPEIVTAKEKAAQLEWLWQHCKIIFFPPSENGVPAYPIEHAPLAHKDARALIEAFITPSSQSGQPSQSGPTTDALQLALRSLQFFVDQCRDDSGTGESHWEQFPEYRQAVSLLRLCTTGPDVPKTEDLIEDAQWRATHLSFKLNHANHLLERCYRALHEDDFPALREDLREHLFPTANREPRTENAPG